MKKEFEDILKSKRNVLKGIGVFEIIGGTTGIGAIIWLTLQGSNTNSLVFLILLFALAFYIYSIFAGITLFKKKENGVFHSRILQYIQLVAISFGGTTYLMTSGGYFFLGFDLTNSSLSFSFAIIASKFQINLINSDQTSFVYLNILAIIILVWLGNSLSAIKEQKVVKENYEMNMNENQTAGKYQN